MQLAVRPYLTSGVALVGASVIAVTPISVAPPEVALPDAHVSSSAVELTAAFDPIAAYVNLVTNTLTNAAQIGGAAFAEPFPALQQFILNQLTNAEPVSSAATAALGSLINYFAPGAPFGLTAGLQQALTDLTQGNISSAFVGAVQAAFVLPVLLAGLPLISNPALTAIPATIAQNFANVVATLANPMNLIGPGFAGIGVALGQVNVVGDTLQQVLDSALRLDPLGAAGAIAAAPAVLTDALLNGYTDLEGIVFPGLLTSATSAFGAGVVESVLKLGQLIAEAIAPPPAPAVQELAAVASPSTKAATAVTLDVTPKAVAAEIVSARSEADAAADSAATYTGKDADGAAGTAATAHSITDIDAAKGADVTKDPDAVKGSADADTSGATKGSDTTADGDKSKGADVSKDTESKTDAKAGGDTE
jgi:hypothetical protein